MNDKDKLYLYRAKQWHELQSAKEKKDKKRYMHEQYAKAIGTAIRNIESEMEDVYG